MVIGRTRSEPSSQIRFRPAGSARVLFGARRKNTLHGQTVTTDQRAKKKSLHLKLERKTDKSQGDHQCKIASNYNWVHLNFFVKTSINVRHPYKYKQQGETFWLEPAHLNLASAANQSCFLF